MPYIVTTKERYHDGPSLDAEVSESTTRRAVATLQEAKTTCDALVTANDSVEPWDYRALIDQCYALPESGGTVDPLPDGTVIEVAPAPWLETQADIDAFNARVLAGGVS